MKKGITLNKNFYSEDWISENAANLDTLPLNPFEKATLEFCGHWLAGKNAFSITTSGTTAAKKTIALSRQQMRASARLTGDYLNLVSGNTALVCLSPKYVAGMMMLVRGFELGLKLFVVEPTANPLQHFESGETPKIDFTAFVPLQLQTILAAGQDYIDRLNGMKAILIGGGPITLALEKRVGSVTAPVYHTFGMSETATHIALRRLNGPNATEAFEALPSVEIGQDRRGCLTVKAPVTNQETVVTNDLVEMQSPTRFRWLGRIDNVINTGGVKVSAEKVEREIEPILSQKEFGLGNIDFFVAGWPDEKYGEKVTMIFEAKPFPKETLRRLAETFKENLDRYEAPRQILFCDKFVRTRTGKIDRTGNVAQLKQQLKP